MKTVINIRSGKLLDPFFNEYVKVKYPNFEFPTEEQVEGKIELFQKIWEKQGVSLLKSIYKITKLKFKRNVIDCFIVSVTPRDMSAPLIIRSRYTEEEFIDVLLHELLHKLFVDNGLKKIKDLEESKTTINHIKVFAVLKYLYLDFLKDEERLGRVMQKSKEGNNKDYARAWEIVDERGYKEIIKGL